jgi:hypothetical protein
MSWRAARRIGRYRKSEIKRLKAAGADDHDYYLLYRRVIMLIKLQAFDSVIWEEEG